ncbi:MAG TPA: GAF domain-containing protein [Oceanobacillus sp.]|nr:GAF domain-containing protein [Oceanobacillus sp.]
MFRTLINPKIYVTTLEQDRARLIYLGTAVLLFLFTLYALLVREERTGTTTFQSALSDPTGLTALISAYVMGVLTLVATWRGWHLISGYGLGILWFFSGLQIAFQEGFTQAGNGIALVILMLLTGLLMREQGIIVGYIVAVATLLAGYGRGAAATGGEYAPSTLLTLILQLTGIAVLIYLFLRSTQLTRSETLARASEDRLSLANINTQIAQRISRRQNLAEVLNTTVEQIRDSYPDLYHVQIFLIDEARNMARLAASTGDVGRLLMRREHSLAVGSQSVIGQVTATGEAVIARAGTSNTVHRRNEFLPDTMAEAAFPLRIGDQIIGALDLQSKIADAFHETDLPIYQSLADNIAVAIDNTRLVEQTTQRLLENQQLVQQMRDAMQQVERLNRQLTAKAWSDYLLGRESDMSVMFDAERNAVQRGTEWTPTLSQAVRENTIVQKQEGDQSIIAIPVQVRGQPIGALEFEVESGTLMPEDIELVQTVVERFGLAVESARLFDESQRVARREATLNEIGGRLQSSNNVDAVLSEAARSLQSTLGAQRVAIRLGSPGAGNGGQRNGSS